MLTKLQEILLINAPAYICAVLALWRKFNNGQYYEGTILLLLMLDLAGVAYLTAGMLDPATFFDDTTKLWLSGLTSIIVPLLYMFHATATGRAKVDKVTILLFFIAVMVFLPPASLELIPAYAVRYYAQPMNSMCLSIYYKNTFLFDIEWIALVLLLQTSISLFQVRKVVRFVKSQGAHYSKVSRAVLVWDFNCGVFLAVFYFFPEAYWVNPVLQMVFLIMASVIIGVGCFLIFLGFDLNPVSDEEGQRTSMKEFIRENGELISRLRYLLEEEKIYLERGIQAETVIQRLDTNHVYFERIMRSQYGLSFPEYVHRSRINYAQKILERHRRIPASISPNLEKLAQECGYEDTKTFLSMYHRITGEGAPINA